MTLVKANVGNFDIVNFFYLYRNKNCKLLLFYFISHLLRIIKFICVIQFIFILMSHNLLVIYHLDII